MDSKLRRTYWLGGRTGRESSSPHQRSCEYCCQRIGFHSRCWWSRRYSQRWLPKYRTGSPAHRYECQWSTRTSRQCRYPYNNDRQSYYPHMFRLGMFKRKFWWKCLQNSWAKGIPTRIYGIQSTYRRSTYWSHSKYRQPSMSVYMDQHRCLLGTLKRRSWWLWWDLPEGSQT